MKAATMIRSRGHVGQAQREAMYAAVQSGRDIAFGKQRNDATGRLEPGFIPADWADLPGMLEEVHGIAHCDGSITERADKTPAWRKAGAT